MRKLFLAVILLTVALFIHTGKGHAEAAVHLYLNGQELKPDVSPQILNGTTMVPIRVISESLGAKVKWSEADRKVTVEKEKLAVALYIDKKDVVVNGSKEKLSTAPVIVQGSTLLPVRFLSERMGIKVLWDGITQSVFLYKSESSMAGSTPSASPTASPTPKPTAKPSPKPDASTSAQPTATPKPTSSASAQPTATPKPSTSPSDGVSGGTTEGSSGVVVPSSPPTIVQSITVDGDVVHIQSGATLKPAIQTLTNPDRIVIDLPQSSLGTTMNGQPVAQNGEIGVSNQAFISKIRYALYQDTPPTVRIVIDLKEKIDYNLLESKIPGELLIALSKHRYRIVLDAGHGDHDSGAVSVTGRYEKNFNLQMILKVAKILQSDPSIDLKLTRSDDTFVELDDRVKIANDWNANLFVSVHANTFDNHEVKGVETYYNRDSSKLLAQTLHKRIVAARGADELGSNDRGVRQADYRVIKATTMPAVLCEIGYLSSSIDEALLFDEAFQNRIAAAIAAGIKEYMTNT